MNCKKCEHCIAPRNLSIKHEHPYYCIADGYKHPLQNYPIPEDFCRNNSDEYLKLLAELSDIQPPELRLLKAERILQIFEPDK